MPKNREALLINPGPSTDMPKSDLQSKFWSYWTPQINRQFSNLYTYFGDDWQSNQEKILDEYEKSYLILYDDHGGTRGISAVNSENIGNLQSPTVITLACLTCDFDETNQHKGRTATSQLFCANNIRRGAIAYIGAESVSYWFGYWDVLLDNIFTKDQTIGESFRKAKNSEYGMDFYYLLIGDPTFKPKWW